MSATISTRRATVKIIGVVFAALVAAGVVWLLSRFGIIPTDISPSILYGAILVVAGFWLINITRLAQARAVFPANPARNPP